MQICLFELANLKQAQQTQQDVNTVSSSSGKKNNITHATNAVESAYLKTLLQFRTMHVETTTRALVALKALYATQQRTTDVSELEFLAAEYNFNVSRDTSHGFGRNVASTEQLSKRIMFCVDYTAAMSGVKMKSVMDNINTIFELHLFDKDYMSVLYYANKVRFCFPLTLKQGNEALILTNLESLNAPSEDTTSIMYDAMGVCLYALSLQSNSSDWLVLFTGSEDCASKLSLQVVLEKLQKAKIGLIVIGIGAEVSVRVKSCSVDYCCV